MGLPREVLLVRTLTPSPMVTPSELAPYPLKPPPYTLYTPDFQKDYDKGLNLPLLQAP